MAPWRSVAWGPARNYVEGKGQVLAPLWALGERYYPPGCLGDQGFRGKEGDFRNRVPGTPLGRPRQAGCLGLVGEVGGGSLRGGAAPT